MILLVEASIYKRKHLPVPSSVNNVKTADGIGVKFRTGRDNGLKQHTGYLITHGNIGKATDRG